MWELNREVFDVVNIIPVTGDGKIVLGHKNFAEGASSESGEWIPLWGTRIPGESDKDCLYRKLQEELNITDQKLSEIIEKSEFLWQFEGMAPGGINASVIAKAYVAKVWSILVPNIGIDKLDTFSFQECVAEETVSETTKHIAKVLKTHEVLK